MAVKKEINGEPVTKTFCVVVDDEVVLGFPVTAAFEERMLAVFQSNPRLVIMDGAVEVGSTVLGS